MDKKMLFILKSLEEELQRVTVKLEANLEISSIFLNLKESNLSLEGLKLRERTEMNIQEAITQRNEIIAQINKILEKEEDGINI